MLQKVNQISGKAKPFIKWAGGKGGIVSFLADLVPKFNNYYEPFLGGGAFFFEISPDKSYLSDVNSELINCYRVVKNDVSSLIKELGKHVYQKDYYYDLRSVDRSQEFKNWSDVRRAARFIYLNKSCFNGLFRVNSKGHFNVPFGRYKNPCILDESRLLVCSRALENAELSHGSYTSIEETILSGDFVYFDPPYVPVSKSSNFTSYTSTGFSSLDQIELRDFCIYLDTKGVSFMLSNSYTEVVLDLYRNFNIRTVDVKRAINSVARKRGEVKEVVVTNY